MRPEAANAMPGPPVRKGIWRVNIVLVVFDSLRKDCVGVYGSPPWGKVRTPHFDALASESLVMSRAFPESLPTLPTRRALYTGQRVVFGLRLLASGWGPRMREACCCEATFGQGAARSAPPGSAPSTILSGA